MRFLVIMASAAALLGGCAAYTQNTSGGEYMTRMETQESLYAAATGVAPAAAKADAARPTASPQTSERDAIRIAASVEPILEFPARIGLARIYQGRLTAIPLAEAEEWRTFGERNARLGAFTPISPAIAAVARLSVYGGEQADPQFDRTVADVMGDIRLGAARQHLDAVLIYEIGAYAKEANTWLAIADLTIIGGAILPTRQLNAYAAGQSLLLDVRNGYPYGFATAAADLERLSASWGSDWRREDLRAEASLQALQKLLVETQTMVDGAYADATDRKARALERRIAEMTPPAAAR